MKKPHPVLSLAFAFVAVVVISNSLAAAAVADLTAPAPLPDPVAAPAEAIGTVRTLWQSGAIVSALIVGAYLAAVLLTRVVPWFREGKRAVYTAAVVGALSTLVDVAATGTAPSLALVVSAVSTAVALVLSPKPDELRKQPAP